MKTFTVKTRDKNGKLSVVTTQAENENAARSLVQKRDVLITSVKEVKSSLISLNTSNKAKPASILSLLRELRTIIEAGIPISEAMKMVEERPSDKALGAALKDVNAEVLRGKSLPDALALHSHVFEPALITTFRIGLSSGGLSGALVRYETDLNLRQELAKKFRKALAYPAFLLALLVFVLAILFLVILPNFVDLYSEFGADLPWATKALISVVDSFPIWAAGFCIVFAVTWLGTRALGATPKGRLWLDTAKLNIPLSGSILRDGQLAQISSSLSLLLFSGMPLKEAVQLVGAEFPNSVMKHKLTEIGTGLAAGQKFSDQLSSHTLLDGTALNLIKAGERTGSLDSMLHHVSKMYEQQLSDRVDFVTSLIEPALMVLVGGIIGVIVVVVYLPIFGVTNVIN